MWDRKIQSSVPRTLNQEWLCWWGPAVIYPTHQLRGVRQKEKRAVTQKNMVVSPKRPETRKDCAGWTNSNLPNQMTAVRESWDRKPLSWVLIGPEIRKECVGEGQQQIATPGSDCCKKSVVRQPGWRPLSTVAVERIPTAASYCKATSPWRHSRLKDLKWAVVNSRLCRIVKQL
jgi:hypothetical protein